MAKDPAFLFYSSDFITGTIFFTDEQVGKYIKLLCLQHQNGTLTKQHMMNICKTYDKDIFDKFLIDANGNYYNERLKIETEKRSSYCNSRRENRKKGSEKPTKNNKKDNDICKTYDKHMENENVIIIDNISKYEISIKRIFNFDEFPDLLIYKEAFLTWCFYRYEKKNAYTTHTEFTIALRSLMSLSKYNPKEAQEIVDFLISNGWTTLQDNRKKDEAKQPEKPKQKKMFLCEDTGEHRHRLTEQEYERDKEKEKLTLIEVYYV